MNPSNLMTFRLADRRRFLKESLIIGAGALAAGAQTEVGATVPPSKASISIDTAHIRHSIDPKIYGAFVEFVGRCMDGGVYQEGSHLSDEHGFRKDVMNAASEWGAPILRWPGGDFASGYHWEDGIGPTESRPRRYDPAWFKEESNHFGTDEFIEYCRKIGAEPYICVNLGTGTIQEAANWVEYCNGTGNTFYANLRRKYGHNEPHNVRYWGLGNEVFGDWQVGHMDAEDYAKMAHECGKLMKCVDENIKLIACGHPDPKWNPVVLEKVVYVADYISLHDYEGNEDYYEELGSIQRFDENIRLTAAAIDLTDPLRLEATPLMMILPEIKTKKPIQIACDEWNIWYHGPGAPSARNISEMVDEKYNLRDALWTGSVLNLFQREGDRITLACLATMVNAIGALYTSDQGMFRQTIYFPMKLYRRECGALALTSEVQSPTFSSKSFKEVPYLDVSATLNEGRKALSIAVVNRHRDEPIPATLVVRNAKVASQAKVFEINGASPEVENSFSNPDNVKIVQKGFSGAGEHFDYVFPAHSITLLKLTMP
jgi:alpha-L-arabinofuranosidase